MSRAFNGNSANFLSYAGSPISAWTSPATISVWVKTTAVTADMYVVNLGRPANAEGQAILCRGAQTGDPVSGQSINGGTNYADTSAGYGSGSWEHLCYTFGGAAGSYAMKIYLDGASAGTGTGNASSSSVITRVGLRVFGSSGAFTGDIAELAIWNLKLSDAEVVQLASGADPQTVQAGNLQMYCPILGDDSPEPDLVGSYDLTINGTLAKGSDHPTIGGGGGSPVPLILRRLGNLVPGVTG